MSAVNLSAIRSRFADKVSSLDGFHESRNPFDGYGRSPNTVSHKLFSIGVGRVESRDDDRQRRGVGVMSQSEILVRFIYRVRPKDQLDSYDESLDVAQEVIEALTIRSAPLHDDLQIRFMGLDNELSDSGEWLTFTLNFSVLHYLYLT
jgi:hypothetical protein